VQVSTERHDSRGDVLDKAVVTDKMRERFLPVWTDKAQIKGFEITELALMESDQERHNLAFG